MADHRHCHNCSHVCRRIHRLRHVLRLPLGIRQGHRAWQNPLHRFGRIVPDWETRTLSPSPSNITTTQEQRRAYRRGSLCEQHSSPKIALEHRQPTIEYASSTAVPKKRPRCHRLDIPINQCLFFHGKLPNSPLAILLWIGRPNPIHITSYLPQGHTKRTATHAQDVPLETTYPNNQRRTLQLYPLYIGPLTSKASTSRAALLEA
jgi:hypothetical protein